MIVSSTTLAAGDVSTADTLLLVAFALFVVGTLAVIIRGARARTTSGLETILALAGLALVALGLALL